MMMPSQARQLISQDIFERESGMKVSCTCDFAL